MKKTDAYNRTDAEMKTNIAIAITAQISSYGKYDIIRPGRSTSMNDFRFYGKAV